MMTPDKAIILVAVDGSQNSIMAAGVGARLAYLLQIDVGFIYVLDAPILGFWAGVESRLKEDLRTQAREMFADISEKVQRTCKVVPKFYIVDGEPAEGVRKVVEAHPETVLVVAGRRGVGSEKKVELLHERAQLGAKLSRILTVPVLLVPPDVPESLICESLNVFRYGNVPTP